MWDFIMEAREPAASLWLFQPDISIERLPVLTSVFFPGSQFVLMRLNPVL